MTQRTSHKSLKKALLPFKSQSFDLQLHLYAVLVNNYLLYGNYGFDSRVGEMHIMTAADRQRFAECSGQAYVGYPLFDWMLHGHSDIEWSRAIWRANYAAFNQSVLIYSDCIDVNGTVVFVRPRHKPINSWKFLRHSLGLMWRYLPQIIRYSLFCENVSRRHIDHSTWYLYDLAVKPECQGCGIASQLLRPMLAYFDRIGAKCYLETHDIKNVAMYRHFGFEIVESPRMPHSDLTHYAMSRKPLPQ